ncbi:hypothetical protein Tco_1519773, partial [Tanacetum coccineum]
MSLNLSVVRVRLLLGGSDVKSADASDADIVP